MSEYQFGAIRSPEDSRDYLLAGMLSSLPLIPSVDLRKFLSPVRYQENTNACVQFAAISAKEYLERGIEMERELAGLNATPGIQSRGFTPPGILSPLALYFLTRELEGTVSVNAPTYMRNTLKLLASVGVPEEKLWPFDVSKEFVRPDDIAMADAPSHIIREYRAIYGLEEMRLAISQGYTFVLCFDVPDNFFDEENMKLGQMKMPTEFTHYLGGHAVHCVGSIEDSGFEGGGYLILKNSWGLVHDKGFFYMPWEFAASPRVWDRWTVLV